MALNADQIGLLIHPWFQNVHSRGPWTGQTTIGDSFLQLNRVPGLQKAVVSLKGLYLALLSSVSWPPVQYVSPPQESDE